ncbi:MAG: Fe-S cluster assembly protein SufD [Rikenella sp.]|nr:Fe-S cluster assembly protein SufD [Rikenella sp.]
MDRILKERYKYTPLARLDGFTALRGAQAEIEIEANTCLYRREAATTEEMTELLSTAERTNENGESSLVGDPLIAGNLAVADGEAQGLRIDIPDRFQAAGVLYVHLRYPASAAMEGGVRYTQRNVIRVGRDAAVRIAVYHHPFANQDATSVVNSLTCIEAASGAEVEVIEVAETRATYFGTIISRLHRDARVKTTVIDLDNAFLRRNQFVALSETGADCRLEGVYVADEEQHADNYIRMRHLAGHCTSRQLFKGVVADAAHAAFTGHIYVARDAQHTEALQENHNIVLTDGARIDTRPQLEIYADDVKCNHGATIGRLDPEAIYYMRQRGIPTDAAKRLQLEGFANEIIDRSRIEELNHLLHEKIAKRLLHI